MANIELQKNILATIAYYDGMDYPMTAFEIHKYLMEISPVLADQISNDNRENNFLLSVINELESNSLKKIIEEYNGFYFLRGRKELVEQRLKKNKIANKKMRILVKVIKWLRFVPYIRTVAATGSLAMKNTESESDLDLLIILKHEKMFTGRLLVTILVHLLGKRRHGNKIKNRVCLNHFLTDNFFEIGMKDVFSASEYSFVLPIFGWHNFQKFQEKNEWLKKYKPNFRLDEIPDFKFIKETVFSWRLRSLGEAFLNFNFIENSLKKWQLAKIEKNPNTQKLGGVIIANDKELAFWPSFEKQGPLNFERFKEKLGQLGR